MSLPKWLAVFACLLAFPIAAETGPARLVDDLSPGSIAMSGTISGFTQVGSRSVFLRGDNEAGVSLWVTDGTVQGTRPLGVLCPPCQTAVPLGSNGSVAFYKVDATYPVFETAIWRTDGTPAGTFPLTASLSMRPELPGPLPAGSIQGGLLFFVACTAELGCELWSSDGSRAGTAPVGEIVPGPGSGGIQDFAATGDMAFLIAGEPAALWVANGRTHGLQRLRTAPEARRLLAGAGRAFFLAKADGVEVWASDGTTAGTRPVTSFGPRDPIESMVLLDGRVLFVADGGQHGFEVWSAGARPESLRRVSDFRSRNPGITHIGKAGNRIVFVEGGNLSNPQLWSSRGDFRSAARLTGCPGGCPSPSGPLSPLVGGRLVFYGRDGSGGGIWITDGTGAGTRLLRRTGRWTDLSQAVALGGLVLIETIEEYEAGELWVTDGTAAGTSLVTRGGPGWSHYYGWRGPLQAGSANGRLVFTGLTEDALEELLWQSDGSLAGSSPLLDSRAARSTSFQQLTPFRDGLLVQSCKLGDPDTFQEMRFAQGAGMTLLASRVSRSCSSLVPVDLGDAAIFVQSESHAADAAVWRTDGTPEGTTVLIPGSAGSSPAGLVRFGDEAAIWRIFLVPGAFRAELWLTDGTPEGTRRQLDLPGTQTMYGLTALGGRLLFFDYVESGEKSGLQPWVTDGTPAGTHALTATIGGTLDQLFVEAGGRMYFVFGELGEPLEIWSTDGTAAGTGPAVTAASGAVAPQRLSAAGGRLYFAARRTGDPEDRLLPWVSDGTDGGTEPLADLIVGDPIFAPLDRTPFVELNGRVWFAASDPQHGDELWSTDGAPEGTARLLDIAPGLLGSYPRGLTVWNGRLWFRARDAVHGMEPWTSDGTAEGTRLVHDIAPEPAWSTPGASLWEAPTAWVGTETGLYFPANDGEHGRELWVLPEP